MKELDIGSVIGNYRVVRCIGQGGMGTVYEVEHIELGVHYALKTFTFDPSGEAGDTLKTKFFEEGKVLARLKHPNIAHVFDLAIDEVTQLPYFVMDLVTYEDGESYTAEDVNHEDIDEELVYSWFKQVAAALDYIHAEGIVHRDIKPANLLVDKDLNVVLTDFGISRIFGNRMKGAVAAAPTMVTKTGRGKLVMGTEKYMAPEVEAGYDAVPESDAYALGVMTLRWLTGFFYRDNPGAIALLSGKKYRWLSVLPRLLAPTPDRRPHNYSELVRQLKPLAKAASGRKSEPGKTKRAYAHVIVTVVFALAAVAGMAWFGHHAWSRYEADKKAQAAELKKLAQKIEEERKAKEQAETKKREEAQRVVEDRGNHRVETPKTKVPLPPPEKRQTEIAATTSSAAPSSPASTVKEKPKREFVTEEQLTDVRNYGPIPDRKYQWFTDGEGKFPCSQALALANGAKFELVAITPQRFSMANLSGDVKNRHEVRITRPFWLTRTCITADQWREFAPNDCEDCRELEKELGGRAQVYLKSDRHKIEAYGRYLSGKYARQLPKGYVIRLPTEAEMCLAMDADATMMKYNRSGQKFWIEYAGFGRESARTRLAAIRDSRKGGVLEKLEENGAWPNTLYHVGGLAHPNTRGILDLFGLRNWTLDTVLKGGRIEEYGDIETDPLRWRANGLRNSGGTRGFAVDWEGWSFRHARDLTDKILFHLALAPDLVAEKAWENDRSMLPVAAKIPVQRRRLEPQKIPARINKPRELVLKRVGGKDWVFCEIPKARFNMTNVDGQDKGYHKVELTQPFWMTKFVVSADEWREFAPADVIRPDVEFAERNFAKNVVGVANSYKQWTAYCDFLNHRYAALLPSGYAFRLPTEAEWEWALIADVKGDARRTPNEFYNDSESVCKGFEKQLQRVQPPIWLDRYNTGFLGNVFIGGRTRPTGFGVRDLAVRGRGTDVIVFDTFDTQGRFNNDGWERDHISDAVDEIDYEDHERDPVRQAGRFARFAEVRCGRSGRCLYGLQRAAYAHIVIAPALPTSSEAAELAPFPETDFGGVFLGNDVRFVDQSSYHWKPSEQRFARLVSRENVFAAAQDKDEDTRGFHTQQEDAPWILLDLGRRHQLSGLVIDAFSHGRCARELCVWASDDGKHERLIDCEKYERNRFRIDLNGKNVTCRYLRIGRKPGAQKNQPFYLNKIVIYGK